MAQNDASILLKIGLIVAVIELLIYGLILFFIPLQFLGWIGANPTDAVNLRWPGGTLIALALGAYFVLRAPVRQEKLVITLMVGYLLAGLAMLFSWVTGEYSADTIQLAIPTILNLVVTVILYFGWQGSRDLLKSQ